MLSDDAIDVLRALRESLRTDPVKANHVKDEENAGMKVSEISSAWHWGSPDLHGNSPTRSASKASGMPCYLK